MNVEKLTRELLKDLPFFASMTEGCINSFATSAQMRNYKKGSHIYHRGDKTDRFFIVVSGWIKLHRETPEGEEVIISVLSRGGIFGETSVFVGGEYTSSAHVIEDATLVEIPADNLKQCVRDNSNMMQEAFCILSRELDSLRMETEHLAIMSAPQRVGCLLLQLSSSINSGDSNSVEFPYDKSIAAAKLGMKPETFSRALAQLRERGVTMEGSHFTIEDFKSLADYCCRHCSSLPGDCSAFNAEACNGATCRGKVAIGKEDKKK